MKHVKTMRVTASECNTDAAEHSLRSSGAEQSVQRGASPFRPDTLNDVFRPCRNDPDASSAWTTANRSSGRNANAAPSRAKRRPQDTVRSAARCTFAVLHTAPNRSRNGLALTRARHRSLEGSGPKPPEGPEDLTHTPHGAARAPRQPWMLLRYASVVAA